MLHSEAENTTYAYSVQLCLDIFFSILYLYHIMPLVSLLMEKESILSVKAHPPP